MSDTEIIDNPELKSLLRKTGEFSFTFFMWAMWVYFCLPIVNILLWALGVRFFYVEIIAGGGLLDLQAFIRNVGLFVLLVFVFLRFWGYYNYFRFGKRERRRKTAPAGLKQLSEHLRLSEGRILELQSETIIEWEIDSVDNLPSGRCRA